MAMTLKDLRQLVNEELKDVEETALIVMSKDGEGNGFSPLSDYGSGFYEAESTWAGEFQSDDGKVRAICLWPTN